MLEFLKQQSLIVTIIGKLMSMLLIYRISGTIFGGGGGGSKSKSKSPKDNGVSSKRQHSMKDDKTRDSGKKKVVQIIDSYDADEFDSIVQKKDKGRGTAHKDLNENEAKNKIVGKKVPQRH